MELKLIILFVVATIVISSLVSLGMNIYMKGRSGDMTTSDKMSSSVLDKLSIRDDGTIDVDGNLVIGGNFAMKDKNANWPGGEIVIGGSDLLQLRIVNDGPDQLPSYFQKRLPHGGVIKSELNPTKSPDEKGGYRLVYTYVSGNTTALVSQTAMNGAFDTKSSFYIRYQKCPGVDTECNEWGDWQKVN